MALNDKMLSVDLFINVNQGDLLQQIKNALNKAQVQFDENSLQINLSANSEKLIFQLETIDGAIHKYVTKWDATTQKYEILPDLSTVTQKPIQNAINDLNKYNNKLAEINESMAQLTASGKLDNTDIQKMSNEYDVLKSLIEKANATQTNLSTGTKSAIDQQLISVNKLVKGYQGLTKVRKKEDNDDFNKTYKGIEGSLKRINQIQINMVGKDGEQLKVLENMLNLENQRLQTLIAYRDAKYQTVNQKDFEINQLAIELQEKLNLKNAEYNDLLAKQNAKLDERFGKLKEGLTVSVTDDGLDADSISKVTEAMQYHKSELRDVRAVYDATGEAWTRYQYELKQSDGTIRKTSVYVNQLNGSIRETSIVTQNATVQTTKWIDRLKSKLKELSTYISATTIIYSFINEFKKGISIIRDVDIAMTELRKVTDETEATYNKFLNTASSMGTRLGQSLSNVINATAEFSRLGYALKEATALAEQALILTNIGDGIKLDDSTKAIVSALKGFELDGTAEQTEKNSQRIIDSINEVSNNYAVSVQDIADAISKMSAIMNQTGTSMEETIGMFTAGQEIIQDSSKVANGLNTISMRLRGMSEDGEDLSNLIPTLEKEFNHMGLTLLDANGELKSTYDILNELSTVYFEQTSQYQQYIGELIAGKRQISVLTATLQNWQSATNATTSALESNGSAMRENEKYLDSIQGKIEQFNVAVQTMWTNELNTSIVKDFMSLATVLVKVIDTVGVLNTLFIVLAGVLGTKTKLGTVLLKAGMEKLVTSIVGATGASTALGSALATMIPVAVIIGGIALISKLGDALITTLEKQKEKLVEAQQAYNDTVAELEAVNAELETTAERIDELNAKDNLTFVEKGELEELQKITKELLIQKDILEKRKEMDAKKLALTASDTFEKQFGSSPVTDGQVEDLKRFAESTGNNVILLSDENDLASMVAGLKQFIELKDEALNNNEDATHLTDTIDYITTSLWESVGSLQEYQSNMAEYYNYLKRIKDAGGSLTSEQEEIYVNYNAISDSIEYIYKTLDPNKWKQMQFDALANTDSFKRIKEDLERLAESGELDPSVIKSNKEFQQLLEQYGLTAEEVTEQINAMTVSINEATKAIRETPLTNAIAQIDKLGESMQTLDGAYAKLKSKEYLEIDDLTSLKEKFGNLDSFENFLDVISTSKSITKEVQEAFNDLATEYIQTSGILDELTEDNKDLIAKQLELMGVSNAQQIVTKRLTLEKEALKGITIDLTKATAEEIIELLEEKETADETRIALLDLARQKMKVNDVSIATDGDIHNLLQLMTVAKASTRSLETLEKIRSGEKIFGITEDYIERIIKGAQEEVDAFYKSLTEQKNNIVLEDVIYDGGSETKKQKAKSKFSKVFDWLEVKVENAKKKAKDAVDAVVDYASYKTKSAKLNLAIKAKLDEKESLQAIQKQYKKLADSFNIPKKYRDLVQNGGLQIETITNKDLAEKIQQYQDMYKAYVDIGDAIKEINEELRELNVKKLDILTSYYDGKNDYTQSKIAKRESLIDLRKAQGKETRESDYEYLIELQNQVIKDTKKEYELYKEAFDKLVSDGVIKKGDVEYQEGLSYLNNLQTELREAEIAVYDLRTEIREFRWKSFDDGIAKINNLRDELADLADMIKDDETIDDKGNFTDAGYTKVGLYVQQIAEAKKLMAEYDVAIATLSKELQNEIISPEQYEEELANYKQLQRDIAKEINSLEDAIANLAKMRIEAQIELIKKETEAYKDLIDAKKDALDAEKELHDYRKSIEKKTSNIEVLQKQISALRLSTDRKDIAERLKLEAKLKELQEDLEEEQYDHSIKMQKDALDDEYKNYEKAQEEKTKELERNLKNQSALVKNAMKEVMNNSSIIGEGIVNIAKEHGLTITDSITSAWNSSTSALEMYKQALEGIRSSTSIDTSKISTSESSSVNSNKNSNSSGKSGSDTNSKTNNTQNNQPSNSNKNENNKNTATNTSKLPIVKVVYKGNKSNLNINDSVVDRLKYFDYDSSLEARKTLWNYFGLSGTYTGTSSQNSQLIKKMKSAGFNQGGKGKLVNALEDEGFALMQREEVILNAEQSKALVEDIPRIANALKPLTGNIAGNLSNVNKSQNINIDIGSLLNIEGNTDQALLGKMQKMVDKIPSEIMKAIKYGK